MEGSLELLVLPLVRPRHCLKLANRDAQKGFCSEEAGDFQESAAKLQLALPGLPNAFLRTSQRFRSGDPPMRVPASESSDLQETGFFFSSSSLLFQGKSSLRCIPTESALFSSCSTYFFFWSSFSSCLSLTFSLTRRMTRRCNSCYSRPFSSFS